MNIPRQFYGFNYISRLVSGFQDREVKENPALHFHEIEDIVPVPLEHASTMDLGMNTGVVLQFFKKITSKKSYSLDGLAVARDGKIIFSGYRPPYMEEIPHITNSTCKTVVAIAVMFAISENLIKEEDHVLSFFPEYESLLTPKNVKKITIRHLLTMTSGSKCNEVSAMVEDNWVKAFLLSECQDEPGSKFIYNSMNTYMLSAIICKVTGQSLMDYLKPRLFEPLGINHIKWELCPSGYERGGWGLHISLESMAKIGIFLANDGEYRGIQLIAKEFIRKMKNERVTQDADFLAEDYSYQLWHLPGGLYMTSGMFGQHIFIDDENGLVVAVNAHSDKMFPDSALTRCILSFMQNPKLYKPESNLRERLAYNTLVQGFQAFREGFSVIDATDRENAILPFALYCNKKNRLRETENQRLTECILKFNRKRLHLDNESFKLFPYLMQGMYQYPPFMVSDISFQCGERQTSLCFYKVKDKNEKGKREKIVITAGHNEYFYQELVLGESRTDIAVKVRYDTDEDDIDVLLFEIVFISAGFSRVIKLFLQEEIISVECMEYPDMLAIIEHVLHGDTVLAGNAVDFADKIPESVRIMLEHKVEPKMFGVLKNK